MHMNSKHISKSVKLRTLSLASLEETNFLKLQFVEKKKFLDVILIMKQKKISQKLLSEKTQA